MGLCVQGDGAGGCCLLGRRLDSLDAACFHGVPKNRSLEAGGLQGAQLVGKGVALVPLVKMGLVRIISRLDTAFRIITPSPQLLLMSHHKNTSLGATATCPLNTSKDGDSTCSSHGIAPARGHSAVHTGAQALCRSLCVPQVL